jgi:hypothetical protein
MPLKEVLGCGRIPPRRQQEINRRTGRIHCPIQIRPLAGDAQIGFVHTPRPVSHTQFWTAAAMQFWRIFLNPRQMVT